jgi:molecular chaperone DnaK
VVIGEAGNQYANAVAAAGPGLVAVGYESGPDDDAAVWTSPDGLTWTRVPHDEEIFGGPGGEQMFGVTAGGPGLVAVGWGGSGDDEGAVVWVSADGYTWERIFDNAVLGGGGRAMYAVTAGGPGLVAVGYDASGDWEAAVWTSADGRTWSRVPADGAVFGGPSVQMMSAVTIGGPGLVAVGSDFAEVAADGAVWTSPDGLTWTRVLHDPAVFGGPRNQEMVGVAAGGPGLVAVGRDDSGEAGDAAVWASADGFTWARVPEVAIFGGPLNQEMRGVAAGGPGLVAVGLERNPDGGEQHAAVWLNRPAG